MYSGGSIKARNLFFLLGLKMQEFQGQFSIMVPTGKLPTHRFALCGRAIQAQSRLFLEIPQRLTNLICERKIVSHTDGFVCNLVLFNVRGSPLEYFEQKYPLMCSG